MARSRMTTPITEADIRAALDAAVQVKADDPGETYDEFAARHGLSRRRARSVLDRAAAEGRLLRGTALRTLAGGQVRPCTVFRPA